MGKPLKDILQRSIFRVSAQLLQYPAGLVDFSAY